MENNAEIKEEWYEYYKFLEDLRASNVCNMYNSAPRLGIDFPHLTRKETEEIVTNWIDNYDDLCILFDWERG